jgi:uncharacterized membrane protein
MKHPATMSWKSEWPSLLLIGLSIVMAIYFQGAFPEQVPTHWNLAGEVDGYSGRVFGAWLLPLMIVGLYLLFIGLPYIDPKKHHYANFKKSYHGIKTAIIGFMFFIYLFVGGAGLGYDLPVGSLVPIGVALLFVVIGYYIKSVEQNWAFGVRTPWTLENPVVWKKTNHLMGRLMMLAGVLMAICAFPISYLGKGIIFISAIVLVALVPIVYSYFAYRGEQKKK